MRGELNPEIDLHILSFNRARFLAEAIESVLVQTFGNFRLTILDDGSDDESAEIAEQYGRDDERITVIRSEHRGISTSRIDACRGDAPYLGWIDSDDILEPTALEMTRNALDFDSSLGMVYTDFVDMRNDGSIIGLGRRCGIPYSPTRLLIDFMTFHFRLIRRDDFDRAGGINAEAELVDDYDLCLRLSESTKIGHIAKPLYRYRHHEQNITFEKRILQVEASIAAVRRAMVRRGIQDDVLFVPEITSKFHLRARSARGAAYLRAELGPPPSR